MAGAIGVIAIEMRDIVGLDRSIIERVGEEALGGRSRWAVSSSGGISPVS
jgi:hypothetical protein